MSELESVSQFLFKSNHKSLANEVVSTFAKYSSNFEQYNDISKCFFKIQDYDNSIKYGEMALAIASTPEQMYITRHNLINVYNHNNYPEKALRYIRANESVMPVDNDRDFEKAYSLFLMNDKQAAAELLRSKLDDSSLTEEQRDKLEFNLGTYDLLDGNLQLGLKRFLKSAVRISQWGEASTFITQEFNNHNLPLWNGIITPGIKLLIIAEAGIGDEIINIRFYNILKEYGINPIWLTLPSRKDLCELYNYNNIKSYYDIKDIPKDFLSDNCYVIPSMHLPIHLNVNYNNIWYGKYLTSKLVDNPINLENNGKPNIGIRWQGNPAYDQDLHRSIPLKDIMNSLNPNDFNIYSLQRDNGLEELYDYEFNYITDLSDDLTNINILFDVINRLDIVITSCTSIAHIAGALGKLTYVIVPISCYYVWCNPMEKTPWYGDNFHVLYQEKPRSWFEPLSRLQWQIKNLK